MEELLNFAYESDDSGEEKTEVKEDETSDTDDIIQQPQRPKANNFHNFPPDFFGFRSNYSRLQHQEISFPTYTPAHLKLSIGLYGLTRLCNTVGNEGPRFDLKKKKQVLYNFQAGEPTVRLCPPINKVEDKVYRNHSRLFRIRHTRMRTCQFRFGEQYVPNDLLNELAYEDDVESVYANTFDPIAGNQLCLAQPESAPELVYTTGKLGNQLKRLSLKGHAENSDSSSSLIFKTPIKQLACDGRLIGVRTFGGISFVVIPFEIYGDLPLPNTPTDFTFHPIFWGLTASITTGLDTYLWRLGEERHEHLECPFSKDAKRDHYLTNLGCIRFGSHPRSLVLGTTEELCLVDARAFNIKALGISANHPNLFWGFDVNPQNPFQLGISTSNSLLLYDLRHLKRPTLDWSHFSSSRPRPHVSFVEAHALLDTECVTAWGSHQGPVVYPLNLTSLIADPFQLPLPGSKTAPYSLRPTCPERMELPSSSNLFGFIEDPGAPNLLGSVLRPVSGGALEALQLMEDGAVYRQNFQQVTSVDEQPALERVVNQYSSHEDTINKAIIEKLKHQSMDTFEDWLKSPPKEPSLDHPPIGHFSSLDVGKDVPGLDFSIYPWLDLLRPENTLVSPTPENWKRRHLTSLDCLGHVDEDLLSVDLSRAAKVYHQKQTDVPLKKTATRLLDMWASDEDVPVETIVSSQTPHQTRVHLPKPPPVFTSQQLPPSIQSSHTTRLSLTQPSASSLRHPISSQSNPLRRPPSSQPKPKPRRAGFF